MTALIAEILANSSTERPLSSNEVRMALGAHHGRHESEDGDLRVVLRIDADTGDVSGDVYDPEKSPGSAAQLLYHPDWLLSFNVSQFLSDGDGALVGAGPISIRQDYLNRGAHAAVMLVRIAPGVAKIELHARGKFNWGARLTTEIPLSEDAPPFRRIELRWMVTEAVPHVRADIEALMSINQPASLPSTFRRYGVELRTREVPVDGAAAPSVASYNDEISDTLRQAAIENGLEPDEGCDWVHYLAVGGIGEIPSDPETFKRFRRMYLGQAFGLQDRENRIRTRFGAQVNASVIDQWVNDANVQANRFRHLRRVILHELAHLLNIPHPWQRQIGHRLLGEADPSTSSVTTYGPWNPIGPPLSSYANTMESDDRFAYLSGRRETFTALTSHSSYDAAEWRFIRHAPLDHIAQGGRTFVDNFVDPPQLDEFGTAELMFVGRIGGEWVELGEIAAPRWHWFGETAYPILPVLVAPRSDPALLDRRDFSFNGALQLLIERVPGPFDLPSWRPVRTIDPIRSGGLVTDSPEIDRAALPWLNYNHMKRTFGSLGHRYRIQAIYFENRKELRTPIVGLDLTGTVPDELGFPEGAEKPLEFNIYPLGERVLASGNELDALPSWVGGA